MKKIINLALVACMVILLARIPARLAEAKEIYVRHPEWSASLEARYQYVIYPRVFLVLVLIVILFFYNRTKRK